MEEAAQFPQTHKEQEDMSRALKRSLLALNCLFMVIGDTGGPLLTRLYFFHGGHRRWLQSWLETAGWPILLIPLSISYLYRHRGPTTEKTKLLFMRPPLFFACAIIGLLTGLDDFLYATGLSYLPLSTAALLVATHLAFTALFAFLIVNQKFTPFSINSVALLCVGAVMLGLHSDSDRPAGTSRGQYLLGFLMTLGAGALYGLVMPLIELTYKRAEQRITYTLVMEMQLVMGFFATAFCTVGMLINKDFQVIPREASNYGLGEVKYYLVLIWCSILWQLFFLGMVGVIFGASSLLAGIIMGLLIPVNQVLAVIFFHEKFTSVKGLSLALSLWGFASYFYGEVKGKKKLPLEQREPMNP